MSRNLQNSGGPNWNSLGIPESGSSAKPSSPPSVRPSTNARHKQAEMQSIILVIRMSVFEQIRKPVLRPLSRRLSSACGSRCRPMRNGERVKPTTEILYGRSVARSNRRSFPSKRDVHSSETSVEMSSGSSRAHECLIRHRLRRRSYGRLEGGKQGEEMTCEGLPSCL